MEDRLYNPLKLSVYRPLFSGKRVLICGAGAVGSNVAEALVKMGCSLDLLDFDKFTLENAAKHSCLVRTPEDVGQNKARCVARRVQPFLEEGCTANGMDTDLCRIGPEALADYDVVVLCLDNDAPGRVAAASLRELLEGYEVIDKPPAQGKDYNDLLRYRHCAQRGEAR